MEPNEESGFCGCLLSNQARGSYPPPPLSPHHPPTNNFPNLYCKDLSANTENVFFKIEDRLMVIIHTLPNSKEDMKWEFQKVVTPVILNNGTNRKYVV